MTTRPRRDRTDELFESLPLASEARALGAVVGAWSAVVLVLCAVAVWCAAAYSHGAIGRPRPGDALEVVLCVLLVVCAAATGVASARWLPYALVAPVVVFSIGWVNGVPLTDWIDDPTSRLRQLGAFAAPEPLPPDFQTRPRFEHLFYVAGLGAFVVAIAMLRTRRDRRVLTLLAATVAFTIAAAVWQLQPVDPTRAARVADRVAHPGRHQICRAHGAVEYCAYPEYGDLSDDWARVVDRVVAAVAEVHRPPRLRVAQLVTAKDRARLEPPVRARVGEVEFDAEIPAGFDTMAEGRDLYQAVLAASALVGIPTRSDGAWCSTANQARAVVALWLAAQALDDRRATKLLEPSGDSIRASRLYDMRPAYSDAMEEVALWSPADLATARRLRDRPRAEVIGIVESHWEEVTDAGAPSSLVAGLFGLPDPVPAASPVGACR